MVYGPSSLDEGPASATHSPSSRSADGDSVAASGETCAAERLERGSEKGPLLMPASRGRPATRSTTASGSGGAGARGERGRGQRRAGDEEPGDGERQTSEKAGAGVQQQPERKSRGGGGDGGRNALGCARLALFAVCTPFTPFPSLHALQLHAHRVLFKSRHRVDLSFSAIDLRFICEQQTKRIAACE